jgi:predicted nucleic acid-binding protein
MDAGTHISEAEPMIAAIAIHHRLEVVTANVRHFQVVEGLSVYPVRGPAKP